MKRKQGISLIVLVITIIVMIILAASVVITLSNTGVINKASQAVQITDEKQIEQLVNMAWADAYAGGKRTEKELKSAVEQVLTENKVDTNKIAINVTEKGVEVSDTVFEVYPLEVPIEKGPIIQLKAKIPADYENVSVVFDREGTQQTVTEYKIENGIKVFSYNMAPQNMYRMVAATVYATHNGEEKTLTADAISVETYAKTIMQKTAAELNMSENKFLALKTLAADILEYGAAAQVYRNSAVDKLVNIGVTGQSAFNTLDSTDKKITTHNKSGNTYFSSVGMHFDYANSIFVKVYAIDTSKVTLKINGEVIYNGEEIEKASDNTYIWKTQHMYPVDYGTVFKVELYEENVLCQTLEYSVKSYVYQNQNKTESDGVTLAPIANLVRTVYNYSLSAKAYLAAK